MSNAIVPLQAFPIRSFLNPKDRLAGVVTNVCILRASVWWMFSESKCVGLQSVLTSGGQPRHFKSQKFSIQRWRCTQGPLGQLKFDSSRTGKGEQAICQINFVLLTCNQSIYSLSGARVEAQIQSLCVTITSWIRTMIFFSNSDGLMDLKCEAEKVRTKIRTISEHFDPQSYLI